MKMFDANECERHAEHSWVLMCCHFGEDEVSLRDYHHPKYVEWYGGKEYPRFESFGYREGDESYQSFYKGYELSSAEQCFREAEVWLLIPKQEEE